MKKNMYNHLNDNITNMKNEIIKTNERGNIMNIYTLNAVSGAIMSPLVDKISKKVSAEEVGNLYSSLEFMIENEMIQEAFSLLHIIIKSSGVRLPEEYRCIIDNEKLRADFVEEAIADLEDIIYDLE